MEGQLNNFNQDYKPLENFQPQDTGQFSILKNIAWLMAIINVIALFINAVLALLYIQGLGGLAVMVILPVIGVVYFVGVVAFLKWASSMNNRGRYDFARNLVIGIIIVSGLLLILNGSGLKDSLKERGRTQSYNIANQGNLSYQDCLELSEPRAMAICGQSLVDEKNDLLACLNLSRETYLLYPDTFKGSGFSCGFETRDVGKHIYNATLLDDEEELTKVLNIFNKRKTDYYKIQDQQKYDSAKNYNNCLEIENPKKAEECSKKIFNQSKDMNACVKFSHDFREKRIKFNLQRDAHDDYYIGCAYNGLVYTGRLYDQGIDFNKKIEVYDELLAQDLYISEAEVKTTSIYKYCVEQDIQEVSLDDELLNNIKDDAKKYFDIDFVYRPCINYQNYLTAKQRLGAISYLLEINYLSENDIYLSTGFASNKAQDYHCPYSFHQLQVSDDMAQEARAAIIVFGSDKLYRPCTSEEEYGYFQNLSSADWGFEEENKVTMTSPKQVITIDNFKSNNIGVYSNFYNINSGNRKESGEYEYQVGIVFRDSANIEARQYTQDDDLQFFVSQQPTGNMGTIYYCNIEDYKNKLIVEVKEFESKIGGLFSVDFSAQANCRGELFDISGHIKTRIPVGYLREPLRN